MTTKAERRVRQRGFPALLQDMTNRAHEAEKAEAAGESIHYCLGMLDDLELKLECVAIRLEALQKEIAEDESS